MATWTNIATITNTNSSIADGSFTIKYYEVKLGTTVVAAAITGGNGSGNDYPIELGSWSRVKSVIGLTGSGGWAGSAMNYTTTRHYWTGSAWSTRSTSAQTLVYVWNS